MQKYYPTQKTQEHHCLSQSCMLCRDTMTLATYKRKYLTAAAYSFRHLVRYHHNRELAASRQAWCWRRISEVSIQIHRQQEERDTEPGLKPQSLPIVIDFLHQGHFYFTRTDLLIPLKHCHSRKTEHSNMSLWGHCYSNDHSQQNKERNI